MDEHRKRLVVCLDGTWNTPDGGANPTNVVKIMRAIRKRDDAGIPQIAFYDSGVGTGGPIDRIVGGAFGRHLEIKIQDGYRFLANNFEDGDEIYLFGFSRGAFTARSLAGFIGACGLLHKSEMAELPAAWELYRKSKETRSPEEVARIRAIARTDIRIRCLGVWDTVGALGIPGESLQWVNRGKYEFHDTELGESVDHALHAVAIDEKRGPFAPTLWMKPDGKELRNESVEQVWFPGAHSNIGGGYGDAGLSDLTLQWMIHRVAGKTALSFDPGYLEKHTQPDHLGDTQESRTALYRISRLLPYQRLIDQNPVKRSWIRKFIRRSNILDPGFEYVGESLHWSAVERFGKKVQHSDRQAAYTPENLRVALENPRREISVVPGPDPSAHPS